MIGTCFLISQNEVLTAWHNAQSLYEEIDDTAADEPARRVQLLPQFECEVEAHTERLRGIEGEAIRLRSRDHHPEAQDPRERARLRQKEGPG